VGVGVRRWREREERERERERGGRKGPGGRAPGGGGEEGVLWGRPPGEEGWKGWRRESGQLPPLRGLGFFLFR
jgi:hypothetical protein